MKVSYVPTPGGRECVIDGVAGWWECADPQCRCDGLVVRWGTVPSTAELRGAQYVRAGDKALRLALADARPGMTPSEVSSVVGARHDGDTLDDLLAVVDEAARDHAADVAHDAR